MEAVVGNDGGLLSNIKGQMMSSRQKHVRRARADRLRKSSKLKSFLTAQGARLADSASAISVALVHTENVDATGTLTATSVPGDGNSVTVDGLTFRFVEAIAVSNVDATATLTATGNATANKVVVVGAKTYKFVAALTTPAVANEVKIGAAATNTLDNLIAAVSGAAGAGSTYGTGTTANAAVAASAGAGDTIVFTAVAHGVAGNELEVSTDDPGLSWGAEVNSFAGGVDAYEETPGDVLIGVTASASLDNLIAAINGDSGEGTTYATGTTPSDTVVASAGAGDTVTITALAHGTAGNLIATTKVGSPIAWGAATLTGGVDEAYGPNFTASSHGLVTGDGPFALLAATTLPEGYVEGKESWIVKVDANTFRLSGSAKEAILGKGIQSFSTAGEGALTLKRPVTVDGMLDLLRRNKARTIAAASDIDSLE